MMKMKLNSYFALYKIGNKIRASFLVLIGVIILNGVYTATTLNNSIDVLNEISTDVNPTLNSLNEFGTLIKDAKTYSVNWVYVRTYEKDKTKLRDIHSTDYPNQKENLVALMNAHPEDSTLMLLQGILDEFDQILVDQASVMENLNNALAYEDPMVVFLSEDLVENSIIPTSDNLIERLESIMSVKVSQSETQNSEMESSFVGLRWTILLFGGLGALFALIISTFLSRSITKPVNTLREKISQIRKGIIPEEISVKGKDEIGEMSNGINSLITGFKTTSEFAREIGKGNLNEEFAALSDEDVLGHSLLSMRDNLRNALEEVNSVVKTAGEDGDLKARIDLEGKTGAWSQLGEAINNLLGSIATPILEVNKIVNSIAEGDLRHRYENEAKGDIRTLVTNLNSAIDNLNTLIHGIVESANIVEESSGIMLNASEEMNVNTGEIASSISEMSLGAQNQVGKVDESSNYVEGISSSSKEMGQKAETINSAAKSSVENSKQGQERVENVVSNMSEISESAEKTHQSIKVLTERSNEITRVLGVITEIAAQTNLLALNAAIEAAQAGEAGRGFAVVAEEIRKLAEDSRKSAKEIETLVDDVQNDTNDAIKAIETMTKSVDIGGTASREAFEAFNQIIDSTSETLTLSEAIVDATNHQKEDIKKVASITESIVVIAEQTATGTEEIASSASELSAGMQNYNLKSEELTKVAASLKEGVSKFQLMEDGMSGAEILEEKIEQIEREQQNTNEYKL